MDEKQLSATEIYESTVTTVAQQWQSTSTISDEDVEMVCLPVLSSPLLRFFDDGEEKHFYSKSQMLEMFKLGLVVNNRAIALKKKEAKRKRNDLSLYKLLRNMGVGENVHVAFSAWGAARTAASKLKKIFGVQYRVYKSTRVGKEGDIIIQRVS